MVEIKITTGDVGRIETKLDVNIEGRPSNVFATLMELEHAVVEILTRIEDGSDLHVREAFIDNVTRQLEE